MVERVIATPAALELIETLKAKFGPKLFFFQSGGCCDNSAANCYLPGDLTVGSQDIYLGTIGGAPFYISKSQFEFWQHPLRKRVHRAVQGQGKRVEAA